MTASSRAGDAGTGRTEVLIYYSGHADEKGLLLGEDRYSYHSLRERLQGFPADVRIAVLDACASGAITRLKGGQRRKAFLVDESSDMRGHAVLTSSSADEGAQESDRIGASFFTHYLVSGLRGAADVLADVQFSVVQRQDVTVSFVEPASARALHAVGSLPGVMHVEPMRVVPARIRFGHRYRYLGVTGVPEAPTLSRIDRLDLVAVLKVRE